MATGYILDPNENIIEKINRHWVDLVPALVSSAMLAFSGLAGLFLFARYRDQIPYLPPQYAAPLALLAIMALLILSLLVFFVGLWVYQGNYLLLTNLHVIKAEQKGLFSHQTSQLTLTEIQDVTGHRHGILQTLWNFGDIEIQTAGAKENFLFLTAPGPEQLADRILQQHENFIRDNPGRQLE